MSPELKYECKVKCDWQAASDWCFTEVGEFNRDWLKLGIDPAAALFDDHRTTWYFRDPKMMTAFLLKWSDNG